MECNYGIIITANGCFYNLYMYVHLCYVQVHVHQVIKLTCWSPTWLLDVKDNIQFPRWNPPHSCLELAASGSIDSIAAVKLDSTIRP